MSTQFRHANGLPPETPIVATDELLNLQMLMLETIDNNLILLVTGPNGSGKTSSIDFALHETAEQRGFQWFELRITNNPNPKALLEHCCEGMNIPLPRARRGMTQDYLLRLVIDRLSTERWVVWVDECENASASTLRIIRHIFDERGIQSALVISGDHRFEKNLKQREAALLSRVGRTQRFHRLTDEEAIEIMPEYQELFANTDDARLASINQLLGGQFREWARLAEVCEARRHSLDPVPKQLTKELINVVKEPMGWL